MKITLLLVGKTDAAYLREGIEMYAKRLKHYISFELVVIPDVKQSKNLSEELQKNREGELILSKLTFSHQMVRLLCVEQIYRAFTILKGEPYHHD